MKKQSLKALREKLQKKDQELVKLLNERTQLSIEVGRTKNSQGKEIYDPSQEGKVYEYLRESNEGPLPEHDLINIFREIISSSRSLQEPTTVAYLGPEASFSYLAAQSHFGKSALYHSQTRVSEVFDEVERGRIAWGVVPVENSLEGSIKMTLDQLIATPLTIRAEIFLGVSHCLISRCKKIEEIKQVYSHPQALTQCQGWLKSNLPHSRLIEVDSTVVAAKRALKDRKGAAIGSSRAATTYGLRIIAEGIEDSPSNTTRFFVIGKGHSARTGNDKTSVLFAAAHVPGSLHQALEPFAKEGINLTRIESYPTRDRIGKYLFFVDFVGHRDEKKIKKCLTNMEGVTTIFKVLGSYPRGEAPR
jgi:chorismate mutase/prephenate dehydratase